MRPAVEGDIGDGIGAGKAGDVEFPARIVGEGAVETDADREDLRAVVDGVVQAAAMHGDAPDEALRLGIAPRRRVFGVERGRRDIGDAAVVRKRRQADRRPAGEAVVVGVGHEARRIEAVDEAGIEIGDEELMGCLVVDKIADTRGAIGSDGGEKADRAGEPSMR